MKKVILCCLILLCLSGCADNVNYEIPGDTRDVGFWYGLWHGSIAPIAWLCSLFSHDIAIYAVYNNGGWYDFGFMLGIGALCGGSSSRKK